MYVCVCCVLFVYVCLLVYVVVGVLVCVGSLFFVVCFVVCVCVCLFVVVCLSDALFFACVCFLGCLSVCLLFFRECWSFGHISFVSVGCCFLPFCLPISRISHAIVFACLLLCLFVYLRLNVNQLMLLVCLIILEKRKAERIIRSKTRLAQILCESNPCKHREQKSVSVLHIRCKRQCVAQAPQSPVVTTVNSSQPQHMRAIASGHGSPDCEGMTQNCHLLLGGC